MTLHFVLECSLMQANEPNGSTWTICRSHAFLVRNTEYRGSHGQDMLWDLLSIGFTLGTYSVHASSLVYLQADL